MQHIITPKSRNSPYYCWWEDLFAEEELDYLSNLCGIDTKDAAVGHGKQIDFEIRRSKINWLKKEKETDWVFEKLSTVVATINANYYGFNLIGFGEQLQLTNYSSENQGMYTWHQDMGGNVSRKLSIVVQLSDPCEYEGGTLQLWTNSGVVDMPRKKGHIAIFPSWVMHQVTPVVSGERNTLVCWVSGPDFI